MNLQRTQFVGPTSPYISYTFLITKYIKALPFDVIRISSTCSNANKSLSGYCFTKALKQTVNSQTHLELVLNLQSLIKSNISHFSHVFFCFLTYLAGKDSEIQSHYGARFPCLGTLV